MGNECLKGLKTSFENSRPDKVKTKNKRWVCHALLAWHFIGKIRYNQINFALEKLKSVSCVLKTKTQVKEEVI